MSLLLLIIWGSGRGVWALDTDGQTWCLARLPLLRRLKRSGSSVCPRGVGRMLPVAAWVWNWEGEARQALEMTLGLVGCKETW